MDGGERLLDAIEVGLPQGEAAQHFGMHRATVSRWAQRLRHTGSAAPTARPERTQLLAHTALVAQVAVPCATWAATQGTHVSAATMSRGLTRIGWPRNNNAGRH